MLNVSMDLVAFSDVLEHDLRSLASEVRKTDTLAQQISGLFNHAEAINIKTDTERSILKLRSLVKENKSLDALRQHQEIWKPFLLACELKNSKLLCSALSSIQKLLAHGVVTLEGCRSIIKALQQTEKANDDSVKLKMLQTILTMLQNLEFSAFEEGVCAVVSICFRIHSGSKNNPAVGSTAAATVRQAAALVLDHAVLSPEQTWSLATAAGTGGAVYNGVPNTPSSPRAGSPQQTAALKLLSDLCSMGAGKPPNWLSCSTLPRVFVLDLMEFALLHRDKPFHQSAAFKIMLEERVCPLLKQLLNAVLDCDLDTLEPPALHEGRLVLRCCTAILRKYTSLVPTQAISMLDTISAHTAPKYHPWQRVLCTLAIRQICIEPKLLYHLFQLYDMKMDYDTNMVHNTIKVLLSLLNVFLKSVADNPDENLLGMLGGLFSQKACGKEVLQDLDTAANLNPGAEVIVAFLALDSVLSVVAAIETLTDQAVETTPDHSPGTLTNPNIVKQSICATFLDTIWRDVLAALSNMLSKCQTEAIILALLKGYTGVTYSAAQLNLVTARDGFLASLCDFSLGGSEDPVARGDEAGRKLGSMELSRSIRASKGIASPRKRENDEENGSMLEKALNTAKSSKLLNPNPPPAPESRENVVLSTKNVQTLRTVFNIAHRLADVLGPSWIHVMTVLHGLDGLVLSLHTPDSSSLDASSLPPKAPSELYILSTAAKQLFVHSTNMSGDAVASMLSALSKISSRALPTQASVTQPRLLALDRMVDIVLYNRHRISETWPILLSHIMDVLRNDNVQVRSAAIEALDRTITGSLAPYSPSPDPPASPRSHPTSAASTPLIPSGNPTPFTDDPPDTPYDHTAVQHMLLVALESLYNEDKESDSRCGILRIVLHILQHHGEGLTRGWSPLLRLLESVPTSEDAESIAQAFPSVELMCSDYLTTMPKEHIARTLDVLTLFASQKQLLNVSLTAIVLLWNACDLLAKAHQRFVNAANAMKVRTAASTDGPPWSSAMRQNSLTRQGSMSSSVPSSPMTPAAATATPLSNSSSGQLSASGALSWLSGRPAPLPPSMPPATPQPPEAPASTQAVRGGIFRADFDENDCSQLLMHLFRAFKKLSMDTRPEVRNSGVRTMFLAVGSHSAKLSEEQWSTCLWDLLWSHVKYAQHMSETSSSQEAAGEELGKERGRAVMMIVHHSRNTEQKQWDETLILTLNGLTKMLRTYLPSISRLSGFSKGWEELMEINGEVLRTGRKGIAMAAIGLVNCILQSHPTLVKPWMLRSIFVCLEKGVGVMAVPETRTQLQARVELVNCVGTLYSSLKDDLDTGELRQILRWLNMFARYPLGADEHASHPAILPQIQKSVYNIIHSMLPIRQLPIWPDVILLLCGFLCPLQLFTRSSSAPETHPTTTTTSSTHPPSPGYSSRSHAPSTSTGLPRSPSASSVASVSTSGSVRRTGSSIPEVSLLGGTLGHGWGGGHKPPASVVTDDSLVASFKPAYWDLGQMERSLGPSWMSKIIELLVTFYRDHAPWQVRASTFANVVNCLAECMAVKYINPHDRLWRRGATAFIDVVAAGIPALNIAVVNDGAFVDDAWTALATAFEQFILGEHLQQYRPSSAAAGPTDGTATSHPSNLYSPASSVWDSDTDSPVASPKDSSTTPGGGAEKSGERPDTDLTSGVLDALTDSVLAACQFVPDDVRTRFLRVLDVGASQTRVQEQGLPASNRVSHMCLRKLYVLCSRGSDSPGAALCQLEVAQRALPALLQRCKRILSSYVEDEKQLSLNQSMPMWRVDEVVSVLDVLSVMTLAPSVIDAAAMQQPLVSDWLRLLRNRHNEQHAVVPLDRTSSGSSHEHRRERTHVLFMYPTIIDCVSCQDKGIRVRLQGLLTMVGQELALMPSASATPLPPS